MERLTVKRKDGRWAIANNDGASSMEQMEKIPIAINRLAAYEDTGLDPEEIDSVFIHGVIEENRRLKKLAQAEKDGRLVVLPCKVGDTVYRLLTTRDTAPIITEIKIKTLGQAADLIGRIGEKRALVSWYSTREEAEAALKKRDEACKDESV